MPAAPITVSLGAFALAAISTLCITAQVAHAQTIDSMLQSPLSGALSSVTNAQFALPENTIGAASEPVTPWSVYLFDTPAAWSTSAFASVPLVAAPICVAYHTVAAVTLQASLSDLASMIAVSNFSTELAALSSKTSVPSSTLRLVLSQSGASSRALLTLLRAQVSGFAKLPGCTATSWPSSTYANPNVIIAAGSDVDAMYVLRSTVGTIGFVPLAYAPGLPCAQIKIQNPYTLETTVVLPRLGSANSLFVADFTTSPPSVTAQQGTYPLVGPLLLTVNLSASCADSQAALRFTAAMYSDSSVLSTLLPWGFARLDDLVQLSATRVLFSGACPPAPRFRASGSTAIALAIAAWSTQYLQSSEIFAAYTPTSSGSGLSALASGAVGLAASDSLFTAAQFQANTTTKFVPAVAFAVNLVFNLPGIDSLSVPRCTLLGLFNGTVKYWDDASIVAANRAVSVPHIPVTIVGRSGTSGTTSVLTNGFVNLGPGCGISTTSGPSATSSFATYAKQVGLSSYTLASSTTAVVDSVAATTGALGYAAQPETVALSATALSVTDSASGATVSADVRYVSAAMAAATYSPATGGISFPMSSSTYPFIGATYFVYRTDTAVPCVEARLAADWMLWALTSSTAATAAQAASYVTPTAAISSLAVASARATMQCGGQLLYPVPAADTPFPVYAPIIAGVVVIAIVAILARHVWRTIELRHVPRDPEQPFTAMFVGVKNLAHLRDSSETATATAMVTFSALVRAAVKDCECVEVHRLNAGTFLIVALNPHNAMRCAIRILQSTTRTQWKIPNHARRGDTAAGSDNVSTELSQPSVQARPRTVAREDDTRSQQTRHSTQYGSAHGSGHGNGEFLAPEPHIGIHHDVGHLLWPDEGDRVRPIGYEGFVVEAAALIADAAGGNQIGLSTAAYELAEVLDKTRGDVLLGGTVRPMGGLTNRDMKRLGMAGARGKESQSFSTAKQLSLVSFEPDQVTPSTTAFLAGQPNDGSYGVAAALHDNKHGVANRRVAVAVIHIPALRRAGGVTSESDAVAKAEAALEMVQEAAAQCRVKILSVVDGTITVVADSASVPQPGLQAAAIAYYCAVELPEVDRVLNGCSAGAASGVATIGKVKDIDVLLGNVCATASELQRCAEQAGVGCVVLGKLLDDPGVRQRFRYTTLDLVASQSTSSPAVERLIALTDTLEEADLAQLELEATDPSSWMYTNHPGAPPTPGDEQVPADVNRGATSAEAVWTALQFGRSLNNAADPLSNVPAATTPAAVSSLERLQEAVKAPSKIHEYAQQRSTVWRLQVALA